SEGPGSEGQDGEAEERGGSATAQLGPEAAATGDAGPAFDSQATGTDESAEADDSEDVEDGPASDSEATDADATAEDESEWLFARDDEEARPGLEKAPPLVGSREQLVAVIESLICGSSKPLTERQLAKRTRADVKEVKLALEELQGDYEG